jgi:coniferyl-aldehyde dehydrogenase
MASTMRCATCDDWMKPQRRPVDWRNFFGASNRVMPQPLGVVGVIVPWNFPLNLSLLPLAYVFAAGNRAMVKMSENSRHLARADDRAPAGLLPPTSCRSSTRPAAWAWPSRAAFDHLLFTGSGAPAAR